MTDDLTLPTTTVADAPPSAPTSEVPAEAAPPVVAPRPQEWPVLGLSLWTFGVAMWSFVTMGELATSLTPSKHDFLLGEGVATLFVLGATFGAWWVALRRSLVSSPAPSAARSVGRGAGVAALSFFVWGFVLLVAMAVGNAAGHNTDGKVTVVLLLVASSAGFGGRRLAGLDRRDWSPNERNVSRALWVVAALVTMVTLAEVLAGD